MLPLNLPSFDAKIRNENDKTFIFDCLRRKYVALTPEEWVRQSFIHFLTETKGYPAELMANEVQLQLNGTKKRCDSVLYGRDMSARMIIEYKAPNIKISQNTFSQIVRYNIALRVDYLVVSNGICHYCCKVDYDSNNCIFLKDIPDYNNL